MLLFIVYTMGGFFMVELSNNYKFYLLSLLISILSFVFLSFYAFTMLGSNLDI